MAKVKKTGIDTGEANHDDLKLAYLEYVKRHPFLPEHVRDLVCEALVREIRLASRWSAVVEAWKALLHVRRMAKGLIEEMESRASTIKE